MTATPDYFMREKWILTFRPQDIGSRLDWECTEFRVPCTWGGSWSDMRDVLMRRAAEREQELHETHGIPWQVCKLERWIRTPTYEDMEAGRWEGWRFLVPPKWGEFLKPSHAAIPTHLSVDHWPP